VAKFLLVKRFLQWKVLTARLLHNPSLKKSSGTPESVESSTMISTYRRGGRGNQRGCGVLLLA